MVDEGQSVDVVYLDFAKAFDKVPIGRLVEKCRALGIDNRVLAWIQEWLRGRKQRVSIAGQHSTWLPVTSGVPQGSVLGPLLFVLYINDIDEVLDLANTFVWKFADDTKASQVVENEEDRNKFQEQLDNLWEWSERWLMKFNVAKCHVLHLGHKNPRYEYTMGGQSLGETSCEKDVGVYITDTLKPTTHCSQAAKMGNRALGQLARGVSYRDKHNFVSLYKTFVRSLMEPNVQAWRPWTAADKEVLEAVQKRMIRMVTNFESKDYLSKLRECGLMTLEERRERGDLIMCHKMLNDLVDVDYEEWFEMAADQDHGYGTRLVTGFQNLKPKHGRLAIRSNFFSCRTPPLWNQLPEDVKAAPSTASFKARYDEWKFGFENKDLL